MIKIIKDQAGTIAKVEGIDVNPIPLNSYACRIDAGNGGITIFNPNSPNEQGNATKIFNNVSYTNFVKSDGSTPISAEDLKEDIDAQLSQLAPTDVNVGYKGHWDASTNSPDLTGSFEVGDWFYVGTAGTYNTIDFNINDIVKYDGANFNLISNPNLRIDDIEGSAINAYDIVVDADYLGSIKTGSALQPYTDLATAIANSSAGDSILVKGINIIASEIVLPHALSFFGAEGAEIKFASFDETNGDIFSFTGDMTQKFVFKDITFKNAGGYALYIKKTNVVEIRSCKFYNNGWNGTGLHTVLPSATSGVLGYDSTNTDLQAFYAGSNASNGGAIRIQECTKPLLRESRAENNLRGFRLQDCGINGGGFVIENQSLNNIESGIYLAAGSLGGCQNITVTVNYSSYNANNGLLCIGGINNKFSQNEVKGNWNAGFCTWGCSNVTLRDSGLYDNNRSEFNGIGNTGDAQASIQIGDAFGLIYDSITYNPNFRFLAEILDTQVHYTGLGSNTEKIGFYIAEDVGNLPLNDKNIIKVDDVGFIGQDYAIDFSDVDLTNLHVALGDNSYMSIGEKAVKQPLAGMYYELPFSNHITRINYADFSVDNTGNVKILEGAGGMKLNPYKVNDLQAIADGTEIRVILKDSKKVQFNVPVAGCSIDGSFVNSVLNQALVQLNNLFTNTTGFASGGGNPVTGFALVSNDLTLTLQDGTSYTVDVTTLGVDENNFVDSGQLVGSDLVLTMTDGSTVTIDATNMINGSSLSALGQNWFISYGSNMGTQLGNPTSGNLSYDNAPIYYGEKLEVGTEFMWTQYHMINSTSVFMSIGVWAGATDDVTGGSSTAVTNWSTKFGFFYDKLMEDTSTFNNGGYSSKNTDLGSGGGTGTVYANGSIMRLVYSSDYRLRLYVNDVLTATTIVPESGNDLDIQLIASNNGVEFPNFIKRTTDWTIAHDLDNSETGILDGIEDETILTSNIEISPNEKIMINLNRFGRNSRIGINYTGASSGVSNAYNFTDSPFVYGSSEQIIPQGAGNWDFNTSALYYVASGSGKWTVGTGINAGMVSLRYHSDNSVDLYSETYQEVIATKVVDLDGSSFKLAFFANENLAYYLIPAISKQTIGQSFQPRTTYKPTVANQTVNVTEGEVLNYQILATDYIVNHWVEENAPSWMAINQLTGELNGTAPAFAGDTTDTTVVNCKASNSTGGVTNFTVTVNVIEEVYTNTKSLRFQSGDSSYLQGNPNNITALQRAGNGTGSSDAHTISIWVKVGGGGDTQQLFHYGGDSTYNAGAISLMQQNIDDLVFTYGSAYNQLGFVAVNVLNTNSWNHILLTYDGGTTENGSGGLSASYSRFGCVVNGAVLSPTFFQLNYGYSGSILPANYFIGKGVGGVYPLKSARVNQVAIWNSDQFANRAAIYNSGATHNLSLLASAPSHYYEAKTSVVTITDIDGSADLTGYSFTSSDLVTDAP